MIHQQQERERHHRQRQEHNPLMAYKHQLDQRGGDSHCRGTVIGKGLFLGGRDMPGNGQIPIYSINPAVTGTLVDAAGSIASISG